MPIEGSTAGTRISDCYLSTMLLNPVSRFHAQQNLGSGLPHPNAIQEKFY